jgi:hypothetical protein
MADEIQTGTAVLFGIANDGSAITMEGYATFILETTKANHKFKIDNVEDENGFDKALVATNPHREIDITWTPSGATRADAAATAVFLEPLDKVTLDNFKATVFNGDYIYIGDAGLELNHKQGKMSMKLRKYDDDAQNASLTTTVSG